MRDLCVCSRLEVEAAEVAAAEVAETAAVAGFPKWDYQPVANAAEQYVRSGMSPAVVKGKAQFPPREPAAPDRPRRS